jgi:molybdate transport repressor ModE-like protein
MLSHLKIRDLELVVALHEEGSITQAAKRVGISEPAFCKRIQLIERLINVRLFERGHDGVKATNSGLAFIAYATEITTLCLATNSFRIVFREGLAARQSATLAEVVKYPWVFFNRSIHPYLHDLILERVAIEQKQATIVHHLSHANQATALLTDDALVAWMIPTEAIHAADHGFVNLPLLDEHIRLETHLATRADNKSRLVSEYVRRFVKQMNLHRSPEQLSLPIA